MTNQKRIARFGPGGYDVRVQATGLVSWGLPIRSPESLLDLSGVALFREAKERAEAALAPLLTPGNLTEDVLNEAWPKHAHAAQDMYETLKGYVPNEKINSIVSDIADELLTKFFSYLPPAAHSRIRCAIQVMMYWDRPPVGADARFASSIGPKEVIHLHRLTTLLGALSLGVDRKVDTEHLGELIDWLFCEVCHLDIHAKIRKAPNWPKFVFEASEVIQYAKGSLTNMEGPWNQF